MGNEQWLDYVLEALEIANEQGEISDLRYEATKNKTLIIFETLMEEH